MKLRIVEALIVRVVLAAVSASCAAGAPAARDIEVDCKPLDRIPGGTVVSDRGANGWSHVILVSRSRASQGDVDAVSGLVDRYARMFQLVILANVATKRLGGQTVYYLEKVAVGNAADIRGQTTVLTSGAGQSLKAELGLIGSYVLSSAEKSLDRARQVARSGTLLIFDAHGIVWREGEHREMILRHVIWVDRRTGRLGTAVWLLGEKGPGRYVAAQDHFVLLPPNLCEDRELHVDAGKFLLGVPGPDAFAIVRLPPGRRYGFHDELRSVAATARFTPAAVERLAAELSKAMASPGTTAPAR
jgi:hypothetical protein